MKEFEKRITELITLDEIDSVLTTEYNLLSVADSEMKNEATNAKASSAENTRFLNSIKYRMPIWSY